MSEQVKRYKIGINSIGCAVYYENDEGNLVKFLDYDALHAEAEALRAENGRLDPAGSMAKCLDAIRDRDEHAKAIDRLRLELEAARGLLREVRQRCQLPDWARSQIDKLTATPAPEVRQPERPEPRRPEEPKPRPYDYQHPLQAEQGERQEAVAEYPWRRREGVLGCKRFMSQRCYEAQSDRMKANYEPNTPQPSPDVRRLVASIQAAVNAVIVPVTMTPAKAEYYKAGARHIIAKVNEAIAYHRPPQRIS